jgi:DNA mismatch repair protein PMS2
LAACVKELLENAIDAKPSKIEIAFADFGASFSVADDGCGVSASDLTALALRHHTSKITNFEDIADCSSFGFRGEALNSICAIAKLAVLSCADPPLATLVTFNDDGSVLTSTTAARSRGTTVMVSQLFHSLPVRQYAFKTHQKTEFFKCIDLINHFVLSFNHIRFVVTNSTKAGKNNLINSPQSPTLLGSIVHLFGSNFAASLVQMCPESYSIEEDTSGPQLTLSGFISNPDSGQTTSKSQFIYLNKRIFSFPKANKVINDVYRIYNSYQYPAFVLNLCVSGESFDRNLSPDKIDVILVNESGILNIIVMFIEKLYVNQQTKLSQKPKNHVTTPKTNIPLQLRIHKRIEPESLQSYILEDCRKRIHFSLSEARSFDPDLDHVYTTEKKFSVESPFSLPKNDFSRMKIIGQFNKGFIITTLDGAILIVDQHARSLYLMFSDGKLLLYQEKFNFEKLQTESILSIQNLVWYTHYK